MPKRMFLPYRLKHPALPAVGNQPFGLDGRHQPDPHSWGRGDTLVRRTYASLSRYAFDVCTWVMSRRKLTASDSRV